MSIPKSAVKFYSDANYTNQITGGNSSMSIYPRIIFPFTEDISNQVITLPYTGRNSISNRFNFDCILESNEIDTLTVVLDGVGNLFEYYQITDNNNNSIDATIDSTTTIVTLDGTSTGFNIYYYSNLPYFKCTSENWYNKIDNIYLTTAEYTYPIYGLNHTITNDVGGEKKYPIKISATTGKNNTTSDINYDRINLYSESNFLQEIQLIQLATSTFTFNFKNFSQIYSVEPVITVTGSISGERSIIVDEIAAGGASISTTTSWNTNINTNTSWTTNWNTTLSTNTSWSTSGITSVSTNTNWNTSVSTNTSWNTSVGTSVSTNTNWNTSVSTTTTWTTNWDTNVSTTTNWNTSVSTTTNWTTLVGTSISTTTNWNTSKTTSTQYYTEWNTTNNTSTNLSGSTYLSGTTYNTSTSWTTFGSTSMNTSTSWTTFGSTTTSWTTLVGTSFSTTTIWNTNRSTTTIWNTLRSTSVSTTTIWNTNINTTTSWTTYWNTSVSTTTIWNTNINTTTSWITNFNTNVNTNTSWNTSVGTLVSTSTSLNTSISTTTTWKTAGGTSTITLTTFKRQSESFIINISVLGVSIPINFKIGDVYQSYSESDVSEKFVTKTVDFSSYLEYVVDVEFYIQKFNVKFRISNESNRVLDWNADVYSENGGTEYFSANSVNYVYPLNYYDFQPTYQLSIDEMCALDFTCFVADNQDDTYGGTGDYTFDNFEIYGYDYTGVVSDGIDFENYGADYGSYPDHADSVYGYAEFSINNISDDSNNAIVEIYIYSI